MKNYVQKIFFLAVVFVGQAFGTTVQYIAPLYGFTQQWISFTPPDAAYPVRLAVSSGVITLLECPAGSTLAGGRADYVYNSTTGEYDIIDTTLFSGVEVIENGLMTYDPANGWMSFPLAAAGASAGADWTTLVAAMVVFLALGAVIFGFAFGSSHLLKIFKTFANDV